MSKAEGEQRKMFVMSSTASFQGQMRALQEPSYLMTTAVP